MTRFMPLQADRRPRGSAPSIAARRLLFELQRRNVIVEPIGPYVRVRPAGMVTADEVAQVQALGHELRELLTGERPA